MSFKLIPRKCEENEHSALVHADFLVVIKKRSGNQRLRCVGEPPLVCRLSLRSSRQILSCKVCIGSVEMEHVYFLGSECGRVCVYRMSDCVFEAVRLLQFFHLQNQCNIGFFFFAGARGASSQDAGAALPSRRKHTQFRSQLDLHIRMSLRSCLRLQSDTTILLANEQRGANKVSQHFVFCSSAV